MSVAGPSQDANRSPSGGSAAAPAASVGGAFRVAGPPQDANSSPLGGSAAASAASVGGPHRCDVTGIVLAGGMGRRMGGIDKGLVELGGKPMVAHVLARLVPQVGRVLINANQNPDRYALLGFPVVADAACNAEPDIVGDAVRSIRCHHPLERVVA